MRSGWLDRVLHGSPLGERGFRILYTGAVTTSLGYTMQSAMAGWLMANLSGSALMVGMVQAASTMPFLLFGLVSGSVADLVDRRYILVVTHLMMGVAAAGVGLMSLSGILQPWSLVCLTLLCGLGYTFYQPAQQASINSLVPRPLLPRAVALGSVAFNAARSVGPALAGLIAAALGDGLAVLAAAIFFLPMLPASWSALPARTPAPPGGQETLWQGVVSGMRFARHCTLLRVAILINISFCFCAAALWAMFPLVAQQRLGLAADGYGVLYSTFGVGAVVSALYLPRLLARFGVGWVIRAALWVWSVASLAVGFSRWMPLAMIATFLAGTAWVGVLAGLSTIAQSVAPAWVRARAVANNQIALQAGLALGSLFWGALVNQSSLQTVLVVSAAVLATFACLSGRMPVALGGEAEVTPDPFLPAVGEPPLVAGLAQEDAAAAVRGPVQIEYVYVPAPGRRAALAAALQALRESRLRNGAIRWQLLDAGARADGAADTAATRLRMDRQDAAEAVLAETALIERFCLDSWAEWQRFPARMMQADRRLFQAAVAELADPASSPMATVNILQRSSGQSACK
ncbi:MAG: MFS transporter [Lautropia sp.]|nr:MFS transporter [Lautropia sp.]